MSANSCRGTAPTSARHQSFTFLSVGALKHPQCIQLQVQIKRHFTITVLLPVKHSQAPRDLWEGATVRCVPWFKRRTFWAFVVSCGLINSKNWTVVKWGTCIVNTVKPVFVGLLWFHSKPPKLHRWPTYRNLRIQSISVSIWYTYINCMKQKHYSVY